MVLRLALFCLFLAPAAQSSTVVTLYGDDDGFGIGVSSGSLPATFTFNAATDDPPYTGTALFSDAVTFPQNPGFTPTGSFDPFVVDGDIISAILTMRVAGLRIGPVNNNRIFLNGFDIGVGPDRDLFGQITEKPDFDTTSEEVSVALLPFFFPVLADGHVNLSNTRIFQATAAGAFQIDFLKLTIETRDEIPTPIPLPASAALLLAGLAGFATFRQRRGSYGLQ